MSIKSRTTYLDESSDNAMDIAIFNRAQYLRFKNNPMNGLISTKTWVDPDIRKVKYE